MKMLLLMGLMLLAKFEYRYKNNNWWGLLQQNQQIELRERLTEVKDGNYNHKTKHMIIRLLIKVL